MARLQVAVSGWVSPSSASPPSTSTDRYRRPRAPTPSSDPLCVLPSLCPAVSPQDCEPAMQFPDSDPYPRPLYALPPSLSSAGSSSARSSACTSAASALPAPDGPHVHVAGPDDRPPSADALLRILANDPSKPSPDHSLPNLRSRSSSIGNLLSHELPPRLQEKPSYDMSWQLVDERDEVAATDDETDDDVALLDHDPIPDLAEERTSAAVVADEGRGLIVQAGTTPLVTLQNQVPSGARYPLGLHACCSLIMQAPPTCFSEHPPLQVRCTRF